MAFHRVITGSAAIVCVALACAGAAARAEGQRDADHAGDLADAVLVELYTSQGCSACPPAEALLADLSLRHDVVALALHVDYWDYIGWPDPFARPEHTARQKVYARKAGAKTIYTPQIVIDGRVALPGNRRADVLAAIAEAREAPRQVRIALMPAGSGGAQRVTITADPPLSRAAEVQIARFLPEVSVKIEAGENRGRRSDDRNVVTDWAVLADWSGQEALSLTLPPRADGPIALIVQDAGQGAVLASVTLR
jgi:hypothetical protein